MDFNVSIEPSEEIAAEPNSDYLPKAERKKKDKRGTSSSYLEKLVSKTVKFKVEDLLDLYRVYDNVVMDHVFRQLLFPYARFPRTWLFDQARDLLAGTDRNRLVLTSRSRKAQEAAWEQVDKGVRAQWSTLVKPKHTAFLPAVVAMLHRFDTKGVQPTLDEVLGLGVSRLVFDDMALYFSSLMNQYSAHVADWMVAKAEGDDAGVSQLEAQIRALETEVGILRQDSWYVTTNVKSAYDQVDRMVQTVTLAYTRLLFRFAHSLRGVTSTEENFSSGYEGLIRAARNYDPVDGSSFTAHCQWWVRSAVLQRQRQASVILLPTTTWYQLSLMNKGQAPDLTVARQSDLRERAEMFYASSHNANKHVSIEDGEDDVTFESVKVTSPDAHLVLGDALAASQSVDDVYENNDFIAASKDAITSALSLVHDEDPSLVFPLLLWALNSGIDAALLAETVSDLFVEQTTLSTESQRHKAASLRLKTLN